MEIPSRRGSSINPPVFYTSAFIITVLVLYASIFPETAQHNFSQIQGWIVDHLSWFYVLTVAIILLSTVYLAVSRYGDIKLGPDHSKPDYKNGSWFAMLFFCRDGNWLDVLRCSRTGDALCFTAGRRPQHHRSCSRSNEVNVLPLGLTRVGNLRDGGIDSRFLRLPAWLTTPVCQPKHEPADFEITYKSGCLGEHNAKASYHY